MRVEGEPFIRRLDEDAAPATHALFGELLLPLKSTYVLNHRVAEDDIEAARLKIGSASIADNVNSPRRFICGWSYTSRMVICRVGISYSWSS